MEPGRRREKKFRARPALCRRKIALVIARGTASLRRRPPGIPAPLCPALPRLDRLNVSAMRELERLAQQGQRRQRGRRARRDGSPALMTGWKRNAARSARRP